MSTNEIVVRRATSEARLEDLRRLQAEQAERERQRLGIAQHAITLLDEQFRELIKRRDEAARRLPDLHLQEPTWPAVAATDSNAVGVENYAAKLQSLVIAFERQLHTAIQNAEAVLADRLARAAAWRDATALENAVGMCRESLSDTCQAVQEKPPVLQVFERPDLKASLPKLQHYVAALRSHVAELQQQVISAQRRLETRRLGHTVSGSQLAVRSSAQEALAQHAAQQSAKAHQALQSTLLEALKEARFNMAELSIGTQIFLKAAAEASEATPQQHEHIRRLVARERALQGHVARALHLMQAPPDLVHAHPERAARWQTLVQELQGVAAGLAPFSPQIDLEYAQIQKDAQRDLDRRFVESEFAMALREQDFHVASDEDGRLVIEDLRHLGVWLEETQALDLADSERGGIASVLELKTDAPLNDFMNDEQVIASVCERLHAASQSSDKATGEHEVLERKKIIARARRPSKPKSLAAPV